MKFIFAKAALVVACLHGSIQVSNIESNAYFEDDDKYSSGISALSIIWSWGINKANADTEVITITGSRPTYSPYYAHPYGSSDYTSWQNSGSNSYGPSPSSPSPAPAQTEAGYQKCLSDKQGLYAPCFSFRESMSINANYICVAGATLVGATNVYLGIILSQQCVSSRASASRLNQTHCLLKVVDAQATCRKS